MSSNQVDIFVPSFLNDNYQNSLGKCYIVFQGKFSNTYWPYIEFNTIDKVFMDFDLTSATISGIYYLDRVR